MNLPKVVFSDWLGTLVSHKMLSNYFMQRIHISKEKSNENASNLSIEEVFLLKAAIKDQGSCFIPYSWALLKKFHQLGSKIIIVSNGSSREILEILNYAPFSEIFLVLGSDKFLPKPNKEMFEHGLELAKVSKKDAIMIGDSKVDSDAATNAGIKYYEINDKFETNFKVAQEFDFI